MLKHVATIEALLQTLVKSETFHALVVQSPPGWAKSTTIDRVLRTLGQPFVAMGSYATPLHIYNTLSEHPRSLIVLDDCAGLFSDLKSMAILKAATWQSSGYPAANAPTAVSLGRRIAWGSTSEKVTTPAFDFDGKLILLTNTIATGQETEAFLSRCLSYRIALDTTEIKTMLLAAAKSSEHYANTPLAESVAAFLCGESERLDLNRVSLRTLRLGYDLAVTHPSGWQDLLRVILPLSGPRTAQTEAFPSNVRTEEQIAQYVAKTGKSRRSYFYEKKKLGLSRTYHPRSAP